MYVCSNCETQLNAEGVCPACHKAHNFETAVRVPPDVKPQQDTDAPASSLAVAALVLGIVSFFIGGLITAVLATWLGATAMDDYKEQGGSLKTWSYAKLGRNLGCIYIVLCAALVFIVVILVGVFNFGRYQY